MAQPTANPDGATVSLDVFTVKEDSSRANGSSNLASATRLNTPVEDIPLSISVVNAALLRYASSITVVTRQFLGVTGVQVALPGYL